MKLRQMILTAGIIMSTAACIGQRLSSQVASKPPEIHPFLELGQSSGWVKLGFYEHGQEKPQGELYMVVDRKTREKILRPAADGDHIILAGNDVYIAGYWKRGHRNQGNPKTTPAQAVFDDDALTPVRLRAGTVVKVEEILTVPTDEEGVTRIIWARVTEVKKK